MGPNLPLSPPRCLVSGGAGPVRSLRALLWTCSVPLFCERPAMCSGRLTFSLSFAVPRFKLVTHKSSLRLSSGHSGPVPTLSNAARSSPFRPRLLVADAAAWGTFLLGVVFKHVICGFYLLFIVPLPVRLPSEIQKLPPDPPGQDSLPGMYLRPYLFCLSFYLLCFVLPPFEDNGLLLWVPDDLS